MLPRVVGLVGPIRAGKSTVSEILCSDFGYLKASNSELLRDILDRLELPPLRENLGKLGDAIFEVLGNDTLAHHRIRHLGIGRIVVDGIRYMEEIEAYQALPDFLLIAVDCSESERYRRMVNAGDHQKDIASSDIQRFSQLASNRSELSVPQLMLSAAHTFTNESDVASLQQDVRNFMIRYAQH